MSKSKKAQSTEAKVSDSLSLLEVAALYDLSSVYVRNAIRHGELKTTLVPVAPESKTMKHMITREDASAWRESRKSRSRREDGRNKFTMYATPAELEQIQSLLANADVQALIERAHQKKDDGAEVEAELVAELQ